jgi:hypothetical protein
MGHIHYFFLEDWKLVTDFQHTAGIRELYADQMGSRLIVVDDRSEGYIYSPVSMVLCCRSDLSLHGEAKAAVMADYRSLYLSWKSTTVKGHFSTF